MDSVSKLLVACTLICFSGCASWSDHHYEKTQRARARQAWHQHGTKCHNQTCQKDYAAGWKDGFYDIATGGKGCPPVVAPCKYWSPSQILDECDSRRIAYYNGFQDGVACSLQYPQTHYLKLWSSCECPLPTCENRCSPGVQCMTPVLEPCGVVHEGSEFLIEDDYHYPGVQGSFEPEEKDLPVAEPIPVPKIDKAKPLQPSIENSPQESSDDESGTSVRFSEPYQLDEHGLAIPSNGLVGAF